VEELVQGKARRKSLEDILNELSRTKLDLILAINMAIAERTMPAKKLDKDTAAGASNRQDRVGYNMSGTIVGGVEQNDDELRLSRQGEYAGS
jgi:hypothetical protein